MLAAELSYVISQKHCWQERLYQRPRDSWREQDIPLCWLWSRVMAPLHLPPLISRQNVSLSLEPEGQGLVIKLEF